MIPLSGSVSVSICTISIPARSISCIRVLTRDEKTGRGRQQTLVNSARQLGHRGITAVGSDDTKGLDDSRDRPEQTKQRRQVGKRREHPEKPLQLRYLQLAGFLNNFAQL